MCEAQISRTTPGDEERRERVLDHGRDCLRRVKGDTTWEDWMGIGAALPPEEQSAVTERLLEIGTEMAELMPTSPAELLGDWG
jgi:hypothetical protein